MHAEEFVMRLAVALALALGIGLAQQAADMSGTWRLNVEKSSWGKHPKPSGGTVTIVHKEPSFQYSGKIETGQGSETADRRSFDFSGTIDGQEHPLGGSQGQGTASIRRVDSNTIESQLKSKDGKVLETARTSISRDGKLLTREVKGLGPKGEISWTEIYDRQ
jgi:hypothetical protein